LHKLLSDPTNPHVVHALVAEDAKYASLNSTPRTSNGSRCGAGSHDEPGALLQTFVDVNRYWTNEAFEITDMFGDGGSVAAFGSFTRGLSASRDRVHACMQAWMGPRDCHMHLTTSFNPTEET
jgi:hypothetical protein